MDFRNRVIELRRVPPAELHDHPKNVRVHTDEQRDLLRDLLSTIGIADAIPVYVEEDGRLVILNGHLRKSELLAEPLVPIAVTDLTPAEAAIVIGTYDAVGDLAETDQKRLEQLSRETAASFPDFDLSKWHDDLIGKLESQAGPGLRIPGSNKVERSGSADKIKIGKLGVSLSTENGNRLHSILKQYVAKNGSTIGFADLIVSSLPRFQQ